MSSKPRVLIANGVNLDLLGQRERSVYGKKTLFDLEEHIKNKIPELSSKAGLQGCSVTFFQTNDEFKLLEKISEKWDGLVINPGAWTHTSLALADRLVGLSLPFVEVHISKLSEREDFRQHSFCAPHAISVVQGKGFESYIIGLEKLLQHLSKS